VHGAASKKLQIRYTKQTKNKKISQIPKAIDKQKNRKEAALEPYI
jgi:hypothetical protein